MYKLKARQWNSCIQKLAHKIGMHYSPKNCIFCNFGPLVWVHDTNIFENIFVINKNFITTYLIKQLLDTIAYQNSKILFFLLQPNDHCCNWCSSASVCSSRMVIQRTQYNACIWSRSPTLLCKCPLWRQCWEWEQGNQGRLIWLNYFRKCVQNARIGLCF